MIFILDILEDYQISNLTYDICNMVDGKTMTIADVMSESVISVDASVTVNEAAKMM